MLIFVCCPCLALADSGLQLFSADYTLSVDGQVVGHGTRSLRALDDHTYQFTTTADAGMLAHADEQSTFVRLPTGALQPLHYQLNRSMLFSHRHTDLAFNWPEKILTTQTERDPQRTFRLMPDTLDKLVVEIRMRQDLAQNRTPLEYNLADADGIRTYRYVRGAHETLKTALGALDTLRIEHPEPKDSPRSTVFWVAPSLDYIPVQVTQNEHGTIFILKISALRKTNMTQPISASQVPPNSQEPSLDNLHLPDIPKPTPP